MRCTHLTSAVFQGNAPKTLKGVFRGTASGFTVYYTAGATGFTSPTWTDSAGDSYPASSNPPPTVATAQVAASAPMPKPADTIPAIAAQPNGGGSNSGPATS